MSEAGARARQRRLRVTTGCRTCRKRHVKCDEGKPTCANCGKKHRQCHYDEPVPRREKSAHTPVSPGAGASPSHSPAARTPKRPTVDTIDPLLLEETTTLEAGLHTPATESCPPASVAGAHPPLSAGTPLSPGLMTIDSILLSGAERWADHQDQHGQHIPALGMLHVEGVTPHGTQLDTLPPLSPVLRVRERLTLTEAEAFIFRNYVENLSHWIDSFSHDRPFFRTVPVLALQCPPLLHACLAFSAKQMSLAGMSDFSVAHEGAEVRYYQLALNAISALLLQPQYAHSDEVLAACVILSTYEMLDVIGESMGSHLKGVAAILQSRHIHGDMEGVRGACYWTWYRHAIWIALKSGRRMSIDETYWKPKEVESFDNLPVEDIANRVLFILGQCVSYFNDPDQCLQDDADWARARNAKAVVLEKALEDWKVKLPPSMACFPLDNSAPDGSSCTWFLSPQSAIAHEAYHACNIILSINRPPPTPKPGGLGIYSFLNLRQKIAKSCEEIFLVANAGIPNAWSLVSVQCLYIAGLVMDKVHMKLRTLELIEDCQLRTGRRTVFLAEELRRLWEREPDVQ
ncbi:hypothetical protein GQ53DRAFT_838975 [Thozetella sp. PMI_491]|nr:hypothetical protein GQ53DRAFT_838975 [Thozetella sp. PMI_491]